MSAAITELRQQVDAFNEEYPVGQRVALRDEGGNVIYTTTRARAQVLSDHSAVIWLNGITGCRPLDNVRPHDGGQA